MVAAVHMTSANAQLSKPTRLVRLMVSISWRNRQQMPSGRGHAGMSRLRWPPGMYRRRRRPFRVRPLRTGGRIRILGGWCIVTEELSIGPWHPAGFVARHGLGN